MRFIITCLLLLSTWVWQSASAQNCNLTLKMQVEEAHNGAPLYSVLIYVDELQKSVYTDESGRAVLTDLCAGKYTLHLQLYGHEPLTERVTLTGNASLKFSMPHLQQTLTGVEIKAERQNGLLLPSDNLNKDIINAQSGETLAGMLQEVNGVRMISNGATIAKPVIHGLHSNRIVLVNNGIRQEDQQWGTEHAPNIDPFLANKIKVIKGAAGVRYGTDAIAGVVLVEPAPVTTIAGWKGEANLAAFSNNRMGVASAVVEHTPAALPALGIRVQGTYKKGGNYRIPGYWVANTGVEEHNYSATLAWRKVHYGAEVFYSHFDTELGVYRGAHTGNEDDLRAAVNSDKPLVPADFTYDIERPRQEVSHDLLKAKAYADTRAGFWTLVYGYQHNFRKEYDVLRKESDKAQLNLTLNTHNIDLNLKHKDIGPISGEMGVNGIYQENFFQPGDRLFIPNYRSYAGAGYLIERLEKEKWTLEGGLRYDYRWYEVFNPEGSNQQVVRYEFDYNNASGTLGFIHRPKTNWEWTVSLASAWRAPQATELFSSGLHHGAARIELGNKNLVPEKAFNVNIGTHYTWQEKLDIDLNLYNNYIRDFIYLEPGADILTIRGYFKTFTYKQTDANLTGLDATVAYNWSKHFTTGVKASLLRARDLTKNDWLILMPADRLSASARYTTDINKKLKEFYAEVSGAYTFRQTRIPANFDAIDFPRPPADYFLLDASVGVRADIGKQPVYFSLSATNLLNQRYRDYLDAFRYFIDRQGRDVVLRIRIPFTIQSKIKNQEK